MEATGGALRGGAARLTFATPRPDESSSGIRLFRRYYCPTRRPQGLAGWHYIGQWGLPKGRTFPDGYKALLFHGAPDAPADRGHLP